MNQVTNLTQIANLNLNLAFLSLLTVNHSENDAIASALNDVIDEIFVRENLDFDVYMIGNQTVNFDYIATKVLASNNGKSQVMKKSEETENFFEVTRSTLFLVPYNVFGTLTKSRLPIFNITSSLPTKFIIYTEGIINMNILLLQKNLCPITYNLDMQKYLIVRSYDRTQLVLFMNRAGMHTISTMLVQIILPVALNYFFDIKSQKWNNRLEELRNRQTGLKNFYVPFYFANPSKVFGYKDERDGLVKGAFVDFFNIVAERGKFTPKYLLEVEHSVIQMYTNETPMVHFSLFIPLLLKNGDFVEGYFLTPTFLRESLQFIITPGEPYTSYEKTVKPFDRTTWFLLIGTFSFSFSIVFIVNRMPRRIQVIVYGLNVQMPGYNIVSIFFGIGQTQLPSAIFPRCILILFIIFCLIFRTSYQSVLYELITTDVHRLPPTTIAELIDQNYSFYRLRFSRRNMDMNYLLDDKFRHLKSQ